MFGYENYIQRIDEAVGCDASYVHSVLNPSHEDATVRIPEPFGRPSTVCSIRSTQVVKSSLTNGQLLASWDPKNVFSTTGNVFTSLIDGSSALNVSSYNTNIAIGGSIAGRNWTGIASAHRLVSAELKITYIGRLDESSGVLCAALVPENLYTQGTNILEKVRDGYFYHCSKAQEGLRMIYMPQDNADMEYYRTNVVFDTDTEIQMKHRYYICGYGLPADKAVFHVETVCNVEYIPDMAQAELVNTGVSHSTLLDESLGKITQLARNKELVITSDAGFDFASAAGTLIGGALGSLLAGDKGGAIGANIGYQTGPFMARGQENDKRWAESMLNSKAKWYDGPLTKFFN